MSVAKCLGVDDINAPNMREPGSNPAERILSPKTQELGSVVSVHDAAGLGSTVPDGFFGDRVVAAAMIDRVVHHAEVITRKGSSHRMRHTGIDTLPSARAENTAR